MNIGRTGNADTYSYQFHTKKVTKNSTDTPFSDWLKGSLAEDDADWITMWNARIDAAKVRQQSRDSIPVGGTVTEDDGIVFAAALTSENRYFRYANENGVIEYNGVVFVCNTRTDALELGDCSDASECIRIALADGGSLLVNRDNLDQLMDALSFFSPEDIARILQALQRERAAEHSVKKMEQDEDYVLDLIRETDDETKKEGEFI